ncbi:YhcH/YjgK/YiaL family protein [Mucilaginibacter sp. AW1-3]
MKKILLSLTFTIIAFFTASAQTEWTQAKADKWFADHKYLDGLKLVPAPSTNKMEFAKQYAANKVVWDKVFAYLKNTDLDALPVGKYAVEGTTATVAVTDNPTKEYEKTAWESHRKFIDLQYAITGAEKMETTPITSLTVTEPYLDAKDVAHYQGTGIQYEARPGTFFLFFPADAHRVNIKADGADHDKKIVIKIPYVQ